MAIHMTRFEELVLATLFLCFIAEALTVSGIFIYLLPILTLLVAALAYRSNKTAEKILLTQSLERAEMAIWKITHQSISWSGNAASMSYEEKSLFWECAMECESAKRYFERETEDKIAILGDNARQLVIKCRQYSSNEHMHEGLIRQFDRDASELRDTLHNQGKQLLDKLVKYRRASGAQICLSG